MEKLIKSNNITVDGKNFKVDYIAEDDMYIVIPDVYDEDFDKNKILKILENSNNYNVNNSLPEIPKESKSKAVIKKGYIISKPYKDNGENN